MEGIFALIKLVRFMAEFSRQSHDFVQNAGGAIERTETPDAASLRRCYRRILRVTLGTVVFGCFATPVLAACVAAWLGRATVEDAAGRALLGMGVTVLPVFPALFYLFVGVALGCLFAPRSFLTSPAGAAWLKLIGSRNVTAARVVCGFVVAAGVGLMAGVGAMVVYMAPTDR